MLRLLRSLFVIVLAFAVLACSENALARTLDEILSAGEIRVGVNPNYPPTALYNDKNELVGFEVDVAKRLAEMLGVKVQFVIVDPASRIPFVTSNKIDVVMGGMTRTPDRAKLIDFSVPLYTEGSAVLTTEGQKYETVDSLNTDQVTFADVRGTTPVAFIQQSLPKAKLLFLENWTDAVRAVATGRATALIADPAFYTSLLPNFPDAKFRTLKGAAGPVGYDCLGLAPGNTRLLNWLNVALFQLHTNGFVDTAYKQWHHSEMVAPVMASPYF
ncbi:MAG: transporter substrate-binding domain-containing protein [Acetobacteraceae bacterium]|nr:transporter substrate-binding domain-containing protein [Acetobacteraceae bacterium]